MKKTNNKTRIIQFRITEEQYQAVLREAQKNNTTPNNLAARRLLCNEFDKRNYITPELIILLHGMYDMLNIDPKTWNEQLQKNYMEGLKRLNVLLKTNQW